MVEIQNLKDEYEGKLNKLQCQNDYLKHQLEKAYHLIEKHNDKISIFEQQLKGL